MEDNGKFCSFDGVIGRRNFIVNALLIETFEWTVWLGAIFYAMIFNPELIKMLSADGENLWYSLGLSVIGLISSGFYFSNILRRLRDIFNAENENKIFIITCILTLLYFAGYTPLGKMLSLDFAGLLILLFLFIKKGEITSNRPNSGIKRFNWGAFIGTWFWGIYNKVPQTLVILPLLLTPGWIPFMFVCGLKGNEWLYEKNKDKYETEAEFHQSQSNQSAVFLVLTPFLIFAVGIIMIAVTAVGLRLYANSNPLFKTNFSKMYQNYNVKIAEAMFDDIEFSDKGYKFFVNPKSWVDSSDLSKDAMVTSCVNYVLAKNGVGVLNYDNINENIPRLNKIKIMSTYNNEILFEFGFDAETVSKLKNLAQDNKKEFDELYRAQYRYNMAPTVP